MHPRAFFSFVIGAVGIAFIASAVWFAMVDSDVFWHIKAGQLIWEMKNLIRIEPFSYVREGLPYIATHEWLAQLVFAAAHGIAGPAGIILLRIAAALLLAIILLSIDHRSVWPMALLTMAMAIIGRQGLLERPQIFSNLFFAAALVATLRLLDTRKRDHVLLSIMIAIQILWVNMHGAAAVLSFILLGAVFLQRAARGERRELLPIVIGGCGLLLAMFVSPNLHHNFTYLWLLLTDRTAQFITEWSPHPWPQYLLQVGPFWAIAIAALAARRRMVVGIATILLATGILSRLGSRHEILFLIAAVGCTIYELRDLEAWQSMLDRISRRWWVGIPATLAVIAVLVWLDAPYRAYLWREDLRAWRVAAPAAGAADFLDARGIQGKIFNTYGIGGYLLFRDRKVFLDGRNVDYGYDHLKTALDARYDAASWEALEERYGFTVAVLDFAYSQEEDQPFEFSYLQDDRTWALVYLDDHAAVYVKRLPEYAGIIEPFSYERLTPERFARRTHLESVSQAQWSDLQDELLRAIAQDSRGIDGLLGIAELYATTGHVTEALVAAEEAMRRAPGRYEPFLLAASLHASRGDARRASSLFDDAVARARYLPITLTPPSSLRPAP